MAQPRHDRRWIKELKKTPVDQLGPGLPHQTFASWFADLVKPNKTGYAVEQCELYDPASGTTEQLFCVVAYTKPPQPGWSRWIELEFVVGSIPSREERAKEPEVNWANCAFLRGFERPTNPKMVRPSRIISTLSDLEDIVHGAPALLKSQTTVKDHLPLRVGISEKKRYHFIDEHQPHVPPAVPGRS